MNITELSLIAGSENIIENEMLSRHTTLKIGGPARFFVIVKNVRVLKELIELLNRKNEKYFLLGNGSNLLASDEGYDGVIIKLAGDFEEITLVSDNQIKAGAGAMLSAVARYAYNEGLAGLAFASGIPGSLGGALFMNAGAYGGEMKDVVKTVDVLKIDRGQLAATESSVVQVKTVTGDEMKFSYRHSLAKEEDMIILGCTIGLEKGDKEAIKKEMDELNAMRREKQPLEYPSAGSTFKRPEGYFAGKLISDAGLKGYHVGDAEVSEKHAGFCINKGNASAADFVKLMDDVSDKVYELYDVKLEPEVIRLK